MAAAAKTSEYAWKAKLTWRTWKCECLREVPDQPGEPGAEEAEQEERKRPGPEQAQACEGGLRRPVHSEFCFVDFLRPKCELHSLPRHAASKNGGFTFSDRRGQDAGTLGTTGLWGTLPPLRANGPRSLTPTAFKVEAARYLGAERAEEIVRQITGNRSPFFWVHPEVACSVEPMPQRGRNNAAQGNALGTEGLEQTEALKGAGQFPVRRGSLTPPSARPQVSSVARQFGAYSHIRPHASPSIRDCPCFRRGQRIFRRNDSASCSHFQRDPPPATACSLRTKVTISIASPFVGAHHEFQLHRGSPPPTRQESRWSLSTGDAQHDYRADQRDKLGCQRAEGSRSARFHSSQPGQR